MSSLELAMSPELNQERLLFDYVCYCHEDRTHLGLAKATPLKREAASGHEAKQVLSRSRLGGLHHRHHLAA